MLKSSILPKRLHMHYFNLVLPVTSSRANNDHAIIVTPSYYLTCCFLALLPYAISGWDEKQSKRWVIASIFLLHDLCPNKQCLDRLLSPPRARKALTYVACCKAFWAFVNFYLSMNMLSHSIYTVTCFIYVYIHKLIAGSCPSHPVLLFLCLVDCAAPVEQLGGCSWFKDNSAVG